MARDRKMVSTAICHNWRWRECIDRNLVYLTAERIGLAVLYTGGEAGEICSGPVDEICSRPVDEVCSRPARR
jgi:hypothetical protein